MDKATTVLPSLMGPCERMLHWAHTTPDAPAWVDETGRVSYQALQRGALGAAAWLQRLGVQAGDTVAFALADEAHLHIAQLELVYGCGCLGAVTLPFYPGSPPGGYAGLMQRFSARWLLSSLPSWDSPLPDDVRHLGLADYLLARGRGWQPGDAADLPAVPSNRPFMVEFTSGTTGAAKAVLFSGPQFTGKMIALAGMFGLGTGDVWLPSLRWPSRVGIRSIFRAHSLGAAHGQFDFPLTRHDFVRLVQNHGVTWVVSVPWQLRQLLANTLGTGAGAPHLAGLRYMCTSGAFFAPFEIEAVRKTLFSNFYVDYGTSEIGPMAYLDVNDPPNAGMRLAQGMEAQAIAGNGQALPIGETGRLRFRAEWIPQAYAGGASPPATVNGNDGLPPAPSQAGFADGWFISSDIGFMDAQGRLHLGGRSDDAINVSGSKLHPNTVEAALLAHPDISDAALVGIADQMSGEMAVAFVVIRRPITGEALQSFLNARLDASQIPGLVVAAPAIPRNADGKIMREPLRQAYLESLAAAKPTFRVNSG